MSFTPDDRETFEREIARWVIETGNDFEKYVIYPEGRQSFTDVIKASAVVTVPAKTTDSDGSNLDPSRCDCGKGAACPLWDSWVGGSSLWTAIFRTDDRFIWWEQRAMV